jgi:formyltetrahydrofolate deformylase
MPERAPSRFPDPPAARGPRKASGVLRIDTRAAAPEPVAAPNAAEPGIELRLGPRGATLLVSCAAERDALSALLGAVSGAGARLRQCDQHSDAESAHCFYRLALDLDVRSSAASALERRLQGLGRGLGLSCNVRRQEGPPRVALFVSKYDHCLVDLLQRKSAGELDCEIPLIVSNHPDLRPLAQQFGIDYQLLPKPTERKAEVEAHECALLAEQRVDLVVLARYMQILSDDFIAGCPAPVINIHHSFLPAFIGARPYHQARQRGVKLVGATAHYATAELDQGPIIEQDVVRCSHRDGVDDLVRKGRDLERLVLARAVRWHLEDRVVVHGNRTVVFE